MLNQSASRTSVQVCARYKDQFLTQGVELSLGSTRFQEYPNDSAHRRFGFRGAIVSAVDQQGQ